MQGYQYVYACMCATVVSEWSWFTTLCCNEQGSLHCKENLCRSIQRCCSHFPFFILMWWSECLLSVVSAWKGGVVFFSLCEMEGLNWPDDRRHSIMQAKQCFSTGTGTCQQRISARWLFRCFSAFTCQQTAEEKSTNGSCFGYCISWQRKLKIGCSVLQYMFWQSMNRWLFDTSVCTFQERISTDGYSVLQYAHVLAKSINKGMFGTSVCTVQERISTDGCSVLQYVFWQSINRWLFGTSVCTVLERISTDGCLVLQIMYLSQKWMYKDGCVVSLHMYLPSENINKWLFTTSADAVGQ